MSVIIFDHLLPLVGPDAATYWATLLAVNPI
ncbi:hypothetical protein SAMN05444374_101208 [Rhodococcoides kroppenstedtii]|jgi:hypothetical protein|uniref:Uncharacterized protein n=1 Tax=Rhodococcoides kroppenstedtii TaxID=293050 RepID=A0A1I0SH99_9NOCA|nr:hypothetical protein A3Q40_01133 [Rhodococcus sp. PBTS 1]SFA38891.1 hypothetical protein SAMN05444374_101208 [Rhodococcus kroppenstedtii]